MSNINKVEIDASVAFIYTPRVVLCGCGLMYDLGYG
jgi:hypothetical protein